jgi:hypothetical protein
MPGKEGLKNWSEYAWAEESLLPGGASLVITSYDDDDDDLISVRKLFARADPAPTETTTAAAGTHKRQISEAVPRDERLNGPEITPAAPQQQSQQQASEGAQEAQEVQEAQGAGNDTRKSGRARKPKQRNWGAIAVQTVPENS